MTLTTVLSKTKLFFTYPIRYIITLIYKRSLPLIPFKYNPIFWNIHHHRFIVFRKSTKVDILKMIQGLWIVFILYYKQNTSLNLNNPIPHIYMSLSFKI